MSYTAWEIIWFLLLALLLGLLIGWIIFGRFFGGNNSGSASASAATSGDASGLRAELDTCRKKGAKSAEDLAAAKARIAQLEGDLDACMDSRAKLEMGASAPAATSAVSAAAPVAASAKGAKKEAFTTDAPKPAAFSGDALASAKANPDDLKKIWGVGPVMEGILNDHGCYTFKQVASLSDRDVEWVAANINTFPDRITRDKWVEQASKLAAEK